MEGDWTTYEDLVQRHHPLAPALERVRQGEFGCKLGELVPKRIQLPVPVPTRRRNWNPESQSNPPDSDVAVLTLPPRFALEPAELAASAQARSPPPPA